MAIIATTSSAATVTIFGTLYTDNTVENLQKLDAWLDHLTRLVVLVTVMAHSYNVNAGMLSLLYIIADYSMPISVIMQHDSPPLKHVYRHVDCPRQVRVIPIELCRK